MSAKYKMPVTLLRPALCPLRPTPELHRRPHVPEQAVQHTRDLFGRADQSCRLVVREVLQILRDHDLCFKFERRSSRVDQEAVVVAARPAALPFRDVAENETAARRICCANPNVSLRG